MVTKRFDQFLEYLIEASKPKQEWALYATYCSDRVRGNRKKAFQTLEQFLKITESWDILQKQEFTEWLCHELELINDFRNGAMPQPLISRLIWPTITEWIQTMPQDSRPLRWLAYLFRGDESYKLLEQAVQVNPKDQFALRSLVSWTIAKLKEATEHLPDYYFGEPQANLENSAQMQMLLANIEDSETRRILQRELKAEQELLRSWIDFKQSNATNFEEWCANRGIKFEAVPAFYYDKA